MEKVCLQQLQKTRTFPEKSFPKNRKIVEFLFLVKPSDYILI